MDAHLLQSGMYSQLHIWLNPFLQTKIKKNNFNWSHFARSWSSTWLSQGSYASYHGLPWLYWLMLEVGLLILLWAEVFLLHPFGRQDIHSCIFTCLFTTLVLSSLNLIKLSSLVCQIMQSIGFLGPAFFLTQLSRVKTPAMAVLCMACSQVCHHHNSYSKEP